MVFSVFMLSGLTHCFLAVVCPDLVVLRQAHYFLAVVCLDSELPRPTVLFTPAFASKLFYPRKNTKNSLIGLFISW